MDSVIGRWRITIKPSLSGLAKKIAVKPIATEVFIEYKHRSQLLPEEDLSRIKKLKSALGLNTNNPRLSAFAVHL
ncbi:MAG: hypothetical protein WBM78_15310 [Desulfobacterales bacterium]